MTMLTWFKEISGRRELLWILIARNLKIRYKNSALGFFWTLLGPIFLILIYATFLRVLKVAIELPVLVTGIIVWQFLGMCMGDSLHAVLGNANLVTKTAFPRIILPLAMVLGNLVNFLLSFSVLAVYLICIGADAGALYWLPLIILSQVALCLGVTLIFSCSNVFFRDTEHFLSVIMLAWFFTTPVVYPVSLVTGPDGLPGWTHYFFFLNPMTGIVTSYRMALLSTPNPGYHFLVLSYLVAWIVLAIGVAVFKSCEPRFGDEL